jgi:hypothetical protein
MERSRRPRKTDEENFRGDVKDNGVQPETKERSKGMEIDTSEWGDLSDIPELKVLPDGTTARIRIKSVKYTHVDNGQSRAVVYFTVPSEPLFKDSNQTVFFPSRRFQDEKDFIMSQRRLKYFLECFNIPYGNGQPTNPERDWPGCEGNVILSVVEQEGFDTKNGIKTYLS